MVREVFEHSGNTFKQYQVFYLQNKQMLPAITFMWETQTEGGRRGWSSRPSSDWILQPLLKQWTRNISLCQGEDGHQVWMLSLSSASWQDSTFVHFLSAEEALFSLLFLNLAFSLTFLLLILRWILGHSMTVNVAVSGCTERDDSILATHWKAI